MYIAIINDTTGIINYDSLEKGCGGSETWALQLSKAFVDHGHTITIFTNTDEKDSETIYLNKVNIVPIKLIESHFKSFKYDFIIISRIFSSFILDLFKKYPLSYKYVFYQFHDLFPLEENVMETFNYVDKIVALTPYHAKYIQIMSKFENYKKYVIIPNGIDLELFKDLKEPAERSNRLLWCSNPTRGLYLILNYFYDIIKKEIPDFGIDIAYPNYSELDEDLIKDKDIKILGSLSKQELYEEMMKHKCWCYPQNFIDTFCISMLEAAMCNMNIVAPWWYAPNDIFGDLQMPEEKFKKIIDKKYEYNTSFYLDKIVTNDEKDFEDYLNWLLNLIIFNIKNYDNQYFVQKREKMKKRVIQKYTWNDVANLYENLYINEKVQHND